MTDIEQLEASYAELEPAQKQTGQVRLVVTRLGGGQHASVELGELTEAGGLAGDRWDPAADAARDSQITLMMHGVAHTVAHARKILGEGDEVQPLHLPGDNFLVSLDLSEENVPAGTKIRLGTAVVEVTAEPHTGCSLFSERFGAAALRWIGHKDNRGRHLRGVHCRVISDGVVRVGDAAELLAVEAELGA